MIPFRYFSDDPNTKQLLQLFKLLRLPRLFQLIAPKQFKQIIKAYYDRKLHRTLNGDPT